MDNKKNCECPFCHQHFTPESGLTTDEHLIKGIFRVFKEMQYDLQIGTLPCPRCGQQRMQENLKQNSLSSHANVYICTTCKADEAIRDMHDNKLPLQSWSIISQFSDLLN